MTDAPERIVLNDAVMWPTIAGTPRQQQLCDWLTANGIDYNEVPVHAPLAVETLPDEQRIIRYTVYLRTTDGYRYADPDDPNQAAREERTAPLLVEPPEETWRRVAGGILNAAEDKTSNDEERQ